MDETAPAILEIGLVLLGAVAAGWVARRFGLPAVVGYLAVGLAVSPFTPGYVADRRLLQLLADLGVVLLLFEVGIEVDPVRIRHEQRGLLFVAPLQVLVSTALAGLVLYALGLAALPAAVLGLAIALSSSVVVVNITRSVHRTTDPPTETALLGWSVLQDLAAVFVAGLLLGSLDSHRNPLLSLAGLALFGALALLVARVLPAVLRALVGQSDFFLIVSVATGLVLAGVGSLAFGLPLAFAAFIGGLAVAESPESAEARRRLLPFRDLLAVLFFVAIGTLVDPAALGRGLGWLAVLAGLVVAAKVLVIYVAARVARLEVRPLQLAVGLGQVGEFSFVLGSALVAADAIGQELYAALLTTVAVSIAASAVLARLLPRRVARPA